MGKFKTIAVFDFDGTITNCDTLFDFIRFYVGKYRLAWGLILLSPILVLFKLGFINNSKAKEILFSYFFKGESIDKFDSVCQEYSKRIAEITRQKALDRIKFHLTEGHTLVIDSASIDRWIVPWAQTSGFDIVIGTRIEVAGGLITGKFLRNNCYGQEKVNRLLELFPDRDTYIVYAYGDSSGDKQLLDFANYPSYREF